MGHLSPALGRIVALACYLMLIVAVTLLGSSLINDGQGMLGISLKASLAILAPLIIAGLLLAGRVIWKAMKGEFGSDQPSRNRPELARQKSELGTGEWFELLTDAQREFYIAGHSMGLWCSPSNRAKFSNELRRILAAGGEVTLVMLGPDSPQLEPLKLATGTDYRDRIRHSIGALRELEGSLDQEHRERLQISMLEDHVPIPYMVVGNEHRLLTATYLARTDSVSMPCLELQRSSEPGRAIYDDFHKLAGEGNGPRKGPPGAAVKSTPGLAGRVLTRVRRATGSKESA